MKKIGCVGFVVLLFSFLVAACATTPPTPQTAPPGAIVAEAPKPEVLLGSIFTFQEADLKSGKVKNFTWFFEKVEAYEKKPALWIRSVDGSWIDSAVMPVGRYHVWDMNFNVRAYFEQGKEKQSASPCIKIYDWPLYSGKKWICRYELWDRGIRYTGIDEFIIESYETVEVPAGTFQVFKINRGNIYYYAPNLGMIVKKEINREISGNITKSGKWVQELVRFSQPNIK